MNYSRAYNRIIVRAKLENRKKGKGSYYELHHILPQCMGGNDEIENLVLLTAEEHYVAHQLLTKMYPENRKLAFAVWAMTTETQHTNRSRNKLYGWVRRRVATAASEQNAGKKKPLRSEEHKRKLSESLKGNVNAVGSKRTEAFKHKISKAHKGIPLSEEHKLKIGEAMSGKTHTDDTKRKIGKAHSGKINSEETCNKISKSLTGRVAYNKGKRMSEEQKCKLSEANKRRQARIRTIREETGCSYSDAQQIYRDRFVG